MMPASRVALAASVSLLLAANPVRADEPIRIGLDLPFSAGPYVSISNEVADGFAMAIAEEGDQVGGRKIEIVRADTTHKPDVAQAMAKKLVFEDHAAILVGPIASAELKPLADFASQAQTPLIIPNAGDNDVTGEHCSPWVLRTSFSNDQIVRNMGAWMVKQGYKSASLIAFDYAAGHQLMDGFRNPFVAAGGKVTGEQYPPFGPISDFGPYLTKIKEQKPDAVFAFFAGPPATAFVKQFSDFGLQQSIRLAGPGWLISPLNLPSEGDAAAGVIGILNYVPTIDTPVNSAFQKQFQAKYHRVASEFAAQGYDTAKLVHAALETTAGRTADKAALVKALHSVSIDGTRGKLRIDPRTNNIIQDIYIYEARKDGDKVDLHVIERIPAVQDPPNGCQL